jgi:hypothetical protein
MRAFIVYLYAASIFLSGHANALKMSPDDGNQYYDLAQSWRLRVKAVNANGANASSEELLIHNPIWTQVKGAGKGGSIELAIVGDGKIKPYGRSFSLKSKSSLIGFSEKEFLGHAFTLQGWKDAPLTNEISSLNDVTASPSADFLGILGYASFLREGTLTPKQFLEKVAKVPELKPYADLILKNTLYGNPRIIEVPIAFTISVSGAELDVSAIWELEARTAGQVRVIFPRQDDQKIRAELKKSECSQTPKDKDVARFCRFLAGKIYKEEIGRFLWHELKDPPAEFFTNVRDSIDERGQTFLMRLIPMECGKENNVGKSGFSSGSIELKDSNSQFVMIATNKPEDIQERDLEGLTALHHALYFGCTKEADWLISKGASLEIKDGRGRSMLVYAIHGGSTRFIDLALKTVPTEELALSGSVEIADRSTMLTGGRDVYPWPHSAIGLAIGKKDYITVEKILAKKPAIQPDSINWIVNDVLNNQNIPLLKVLLTSGLDMQPFYKSNPTRFADIRKYSTPESRMENKEFYDLLDQFEKQVSKK